jgi:hypothetical protein
MAMRLGEILVAHHVVTEAQVAQGLADQAQWGGRLGQALVRLAALTEDVLVRALSRQLGVPRADLRSAQPAPEALARVPAALARQLKALPLELRRGEVLAVAMADPNDSAHLEALARASHCRLEARIAAGPELLAAIARAYGELGPSAPVSAPERARDPLEALCDLLVEKGLLTREELRERLGR